MRALQRLMGCSVLQRLCQAAPTAGHHCKRCSELACPILQRGQWSLGGSVTGMQGSSAQMRVADAARWGLLAKLQCLWRLVHPNPSRMCGGAHGVHQAMEELLSVGVVHTWATWGFPHRRQECGCLTLSSWLRVDVFEGVPFSSVRER